MGFIARFLTLFLLSHSYFRNNHATRRYVLYLIEISNNWLGTGLRQKEWPLAFLMEK